MFIFETMQKSKTNRGKLRKSVTALNRKLVIPRPDVLHTYLSHNEVNRYLDYLQNRFENFVTVHVFGRSYEGRILKGIEIDWYSSKNVISMALKSRANLSRPASTEEAHDVRVMLPAQGRNVVFVEGGTHGREWISISVALNCIYQLTEKSNRHQDMLRKLRFVIVPLVNPDGYEYSRNKNRRWRKNRRPQKNSKNIGTDCNRNYDFHWDEGNAKTHRNTYKGDKPFSEPETCAIRNVLQKMAPQLLFVLSLHSYAQSIMFPWGYTKELPETWETLQSLAFAGRNAIKSYTGRRYRVGSIAALTKRTIPGSIVDYAFGCLKVPLALVMELPASDLGFQPPPEAISPIGHESWYGIRQMCRTAYGLVPPLSIGHESPVWVRVYKNGKATINATPKQPKRQSLNGSSEEEEELNAETTAKATEKTEQKPISSPEEATKQSTAEAESQTQTRVEAVTT